MPNPIQIDTKELILSRAAKLFYLQGFNNTGMEEITNVCGIKKPTLYYHFHSKNNLGSAYIDWKAAELFTLLEKLLNRSKSLREYFDLWVNALILLARKNEFFGCPFTSFASELSKNERSFFEKKLKSVELAWLLFQEKAILRFGYSNHESKKMAKEILILHTGCVMLYRASRDLKYLRDLKNGFKNLTRTDRDL